MANPAPTINQINAFNATQGTTIDFNIIGGTELVRSNRIYIYDLSDNSLICTHLYASTESIHELPSNTDASVVYESGKSSADFVNGKQYYAQIQTFTDIGGTEGGSGLSVAKMFWCLDDPTLTIDTIPSTISTTSYNVSATYNANTSVVSNIIQQYQFNLYSATGSLLQSSGVIVGNGEQQGTSTAYDISYNFSGLSVGSSYYVIVDVTTTQGMSVTTQSGTFTVSIDTPTLGEATVVNNACDGYISVTSNLSGEYGGSASGEIVSFETDSENVFTKLKVAIEPTQIGSGTASPDNVRPIYGVGEVDVNRCGKNLINWDITEHYFDSNFNGYGQGKWQDKMLIPKNLFGKQVTYSAYINAGSIYNNQCVRVWFLKNGSYVGSSISGNYIQSNNSGVSKVTFTIANSDTVDSFALGLAVNDSNVSNPQLEYGTTATDYVPYVEPIEVSQAFDVTLTKTSTDTDPYLFKAVGDIYGDRLEEELVGGTVAWNQLVLDANKNYSNGESTDTRTGFYLAIQTVGSPVQSLLVDIISTAKKYTKIFKAVSTLSSTGIRIKHNGSVRDLNVYQNANLNMHANHVYIYSANFVAVDVSTADGVSIKNNQFIDLTAMFGTTIADYIYSLEQSQAGAGVAWFRNYFPNDYYPYDPGTLRSVEGVSAHETVGFNQWDEEWELGGLNGSTGALWNTTDRIRSKNFMDVEPRASYYIHYPTSGMAMDYCFYDADKTFISSGNRVNSAITTPTNARYMKFATYAQYGTTYNHDICINLSDPTRNGEYEPYQKHTYPLDSSLTLRGIPKLDANNNLYYDGDTYESDGTVTRKYGIVDLGTLTWYYVEAQNCFYTYGVREYTKQAPNAICSKYPYVGIYADLVDKSCGYIYGNAICVRDESFNKDTTAFKTAMNGVMLIYELVTPTTETADPFEQIQEVSKYGTLEYITNNGIPVGHNTTYYTRDVFGGTLDLVSGRLVVDRAMITPNNVYGVATGDGGLIYWMFVTNPYAPSNNQAELISNRFALGNFAKGNCYVTNFGRLVVAVPIDQTLNTAALANTWLENNPTQFCYLLANPLTYQLTPQQIQTLVGVNNVWSDDGNIELSYHIPITNLLVKRQDVDDVSGNWLTLYSQPITQASDMDFTFIDFLNQYGKTYKYALVPLLTQTQSGVEVEVEGGYTVSDEVQSIFDGVFISDSTGSQKCKANVGYGNVNMNQSVGSITPIGSQYPIIVTNSNNRYHNGSISGMIVPDDYYYNGNLSRIDMVNKRNELEQFLTNKRAKIIKDWNGNIWLVMIMDNIDCSFDNNYGMGIVTFNANWLEVGDPTNQQDLQDTGLINVGGV